MDEPREWEVGRGCRKRLELGRDGGEGKGGERGKGPGMGGREREVEQDGRQEGPERDADGAKGTSNSSNSYLKKVCGKD